MTLWNSTIEPGQPWERTSGSASGLGRARVDEVDVDPVDGGGELVEAVEGGLPLPPLVAVGPVLAHLAHIGEGDALAPVVDGLGLGPAGATEALVQVVQHRLGHLDLERGYGF